MDYLNTYLILSFLAFITSLLTAAVGMGGGILLLALLPSFIPAAALIPVHGAVIGAFVGAQIFSEINIAIIPLLMSGFILCLLWLPVEKLLALIPGKYFSLGIIQAYLAPFVGATGLLSISVLTKEGYDARQVIATHAALNSIINTFKLLVFAYIGFIFHDYIEHIVVMMIFAAIGSYFGTRIRLKIDLALGRKILTYLITLLCLKNIVDYLL